MSSQTLSRFPSLKRLINPTERQNEFLRAIAEKDFVLYGGAAGGGKSYILRWWLVLFLKQVYEELGLKHVMVALLCEDYPSLYDRQISKIKYEFPQELGELKEGTVKNFQLRPEFGGGILALRNLDDPSKYQSAEFAAIGVDELTKSPKETFDFLRFRLRWPGIERPKFAGATNPGGKGHAWVKKLWIERQFPAELEHSKEQFAFVQAKASDNPYLNASYYQSLLTLPPDMAKKFAEGDWDVFTGQYFPQFENPAGRHVITQQEATERIQPWHTRWLMGDWGYFHPASFHWAAKDEHNHVIIYRELWDRNVSEQEWGQRIAAASGREKLSAFPFSWDAGRLSPRSAPKYPRSIIQLLSDALPSALPKPHPADSSPGSRMSGFRLLSQLFDSDMISISDACPKLIQCIPTLIRAEDDPENVEKVDYSENEIGDDPIDSVRMGCQHMLGAAIKPRSVIRMETLEAAAKAVSSEDAPQARFMADLVLRDKWKATDKRTSMWWKHR